MGVYADKIRAWLISKKNPDWQVLMGLLKMEKKELKTVFVGEF